MTPNVVERRSLHEGVVNCPLCGRQFATPEDRLIVYGAVDQATAENADAIQCPVCDGVMFVVDEAGETE